ncbi:hypothetical protein HOLleu_00886 [Holothuria leucospilota]|uniref:Uncharacterized protein n=1 Tax=Holothuria leucospilota TaxID=206669 RepID=A0A9Q1CPK3_HOLLE|nr:hypothetical protein HOLleu_00886 [Holothuria leucospilota]
MLYQHIVRWEKVPWNFPIAQICKYEEVPIRTVNCHLYVPYYFYPLQASDYKYTFRADARGGVGGVTPPHYPRSRQNPALVGKMKERGNWKLRKVRGKKKEEKKNRQKRTEKRERERPSEQRKEQGRERHGRTRERAGADGRQEIGMHLKTTFITIFSKTVNQEEEGPGGRTKLAANPIIMSIY